MSALTLYQLLLTGLVEIGLGLIAFVGCCRIVPWLKKKAETTYSFWDYCISTPNQLLGLLGYWKYSPIPSTALIRFRTRQAHFRTWVLWLFAQGAIITLAELTPTFLLITSIGWKLPFIQNLYYNILFATTNGAPNGAHITSYLCVMAITLFSSWKTRDVFLGVLSGALLVGLHEGIWIVFYYLGYWQFITISMWTNIVKDWPIFSGMICLFVYSFAKYPLNKWKLSEFKIPILLYIGYVALWFALPHLVFGYSNWLPIRTANLPNSAITTTQYNETPWFWDPWVNAVEIISWVMLTIGLMAKVVSSKARA